MATSRLALLAAPRAAGKPSLLGRLMTGTSPTFSTSPKKRLPMNALLVSSKYMPEYSGSGFRAHNLYKRLCDKCPSLDVKVLAGSITENDCAEYEHDGFQVTRVASKLFRRTSDSSILRRIQNSLNFHREFNLALKTIRRMAVTKRIDLIHIFGQNNVTAAALHYANEEHIPVLLELCNEMDTPHHYIPFPFQYWISGKCKHEFLFVCISEMLKNVCLKNNIPEKYIWCRPNPIDESTFKPVSYEKKHALRKHHTQHGVKDILLLYIAKFRPSKNHIFLLDVLARLPQQYKLIIGGPLVESGPETKKSEELLAKLSKALTDRDLDRRTLILKGFIPNIQDYYQLSDVYVFPTLQEALGTPMLEAIACGLPVVANTINGVTDAWINNGENGYITEMDSQKFAEAVEKAVAIPRRKMLSESKKIILAAGTKGIDAEYINIMERLCQS